MRTSVCKIFSFGAAHYLPYYEGKCRNLHGHTWTLEVEVSGEINPRTGMVVDFAKLKGLVNEEIIDNLDHTLLNDGLVNPTCENLLDWIWEHLSPIGSWTGKIKLERLRLYETPDSFAEIKNG